MIQSNGRDATADADFPPLDTTDAGLFSATGVVLTVATLLSTGGIVGLVVGLVAVAAWLRATPTLAFVLGQIGLLGVFPDGATLIAIVPVELGLFTLLLGSLHQVSDSLIATATSVGIALGLVAVVTSVSDLSTLAVAGVIGLTISACLYLVHRHETTTLEVASTESSNE